MQSAPFVFSRILNQGPPDRVIVALDEPVGAKTIPVLATFPEGTALQDAYSGTSVTVRHATVTLSTPFSVVLLAEPKRR
jgi:alpha-amylase